MCMYLCMYACGGGVRSYERDVELVFTTLHTRLNINSYRSVVLCNLDFRTIWLVVGGEFDIYCVDHHYAFLKIAMHIILQVYSSPILLHSLCQYMPFTCILFILFYGCHCLLSTLIFFSFPFFKFHFLSRSLAKTCSMLLISSR